MVSLELNNIKTAPSCHCKWPNFLLSWYDIRSGLRQYCYQYGKQRQLADTFHVHLNKKRNYTHTTKTQHPTDIGYTSFIQSSLPGSVVVCCWEDVTVPPPSTLRAKLGNVKHRIFLACTSIGSSGWLNSQSTARSILLLVSFRALTACWRVKPMAESVSTNPSSTSVRLWVIQAPTGGVRVRAQTVT